MTEKREGNVKLMTMILTDFAARLGRYHNNEWVEWHDSEGHKAEEPTPYKIERLRYAKRQLERAVEYLEGAI